MRTSQQFEVSSITCNTDTMTRRIRQSRLQSRTSPQCSPKSLRNAVRKLPFVFFLIASSVVYRNFRQQVLLPSTSPYLAPNDSPALHMTVKDSQGNTLVDKINKLSKPFDFFPKILPTIGSRPLNSDVVELRHCNLELLDYTKYSAWANAILDHAWPNFESKIKSNSPEVMNLTSASWKETMVPEMALGLLEVYATNEGYCDFSKFPLHIAYDLSLAATVLKAVPDDPNGLPRLAIVIVAFKDATLLERLVATLHLPHHYIIIHLERSTPSAYTDQVTRIASQFSNVVVVKFGTVLYRTDSVSMINYQIMNWLVNELGLTYDYHLTMDGTVYPLYNATNLCRHLQAAQRDVWLGELLHNGKALSDKADQSNYLTRKRLIYTAGARKYQQRFKNVAHHDFVPTVPNFIKGNMTRKTNSGNQAVFSYKFVKELTNSAEVKELFATAKYGCCCCLEERTWVAAAQIIGYGKQVMDATSMFQVWGGDPMCTATMNNAVLSLDSEPCYKVEDAVTLNSLQIVSAKSDKPVYLRGHELVRALNAAKANGVMFARKFSSESSSSMNLLRLIEEEFHRT